jgi:hypothetical protein
MFRIHKKLAAGLLAVFCVGGMSHPACAQFETRATLAVGNSPRSIAVGDFNRDGKLDLVVADVGLQVFLGNGDGTFQLPANYTAGGAPLSVVAADLNHDGNLDLVSVGFEHTVSILLGNGDGTFQRPKNYMATSSPLVVAVGDVNNDGFPDLVFLDSPYISIMLGNGDGTFQPVTDLSTPYSPFALGVGDFNGDHKLDLAVGGQGLNNPFEVEILLGNGDGTFQEAGDYSVGFFAESIAVADFTGTGKLDMAVASEFGLLTVFLGNGDGTFAPGVEYAPPNHSSSWVVAADLNGDGILDLAVAGPGFLGFQSGVNILTGNGDGTFQPGILYRVGANARAVAIGDFNGDRQPDLAATDILYNHFFSMLNTGTVGFSPTVPLKFPPRIVGSASAPKFVVLTNNGTTPLSLFSMSVQGQFSFQSTCGKSVPPLGQCRITVTFNPLDIGTSEGVVSIASSASSKPQVIELTGEGTVLSLSPRQLGFPPQRVGTKSLPLVLSVTNVGSSAVTFRNISTGGLNLTDFSQQNNCSSHALGGGETCQVSVTFKPIQSGERTADIVLQDSGGGTQTAPLRGSGTR